jgi:hypothetical protein
MKENVCVCDERGGEEEICHIYDTMRMVGRKDR